MFKNLGSIWKIKTQITVLQLSKKNELLHLYYLFISKFLLTLGTLLLVPEKLNLTTLNITLPNEFYFIVATPNRSITFFQKLVGEEVMAKTLEQFQKIFSKDFRIHISRNTFRLIDHFHNLKGNLVGL